MSIVVERWVSTIIRHTLSRPLFAYGNVFRKNIEDFRNFGTINLAKADVFIYHNTSDTKAAVNNNSVPAEIGTPNYHYYNNFFLCDYIFAGTYAMPDWHDAGNVYLKRKDNEKWESVMKKVFSTNFKSASKFIENGNPGFASTYLDDFSITSKSVAADAGIDLRKYNLPGINDYVSANPDAGAIPVGKKMFKVFRSPNEVDAIPAGCWPKPGTKLQINTNWAKGYLRNR